MLSMLSMRFPWRVSVSDKDGHVRIADRDHRVVCSDVSSVELAEYIIEKCGAKPFASREEWLWYRD